MTATKVGHTTVRSGTKKSRMHMSNILTLTVTGSVAGAPTSATKTVDLSNIDNAKNKPTSLIAAGLKTLSAVVQSHRMTNASIVLNWQGREASFPIKPAQSFAKVSANLYQTLAVVLFGEESYQSPVARQTNPIASLISRIFGVKREDGISFAEFKEVTKLKFAELLTFEELQTMQVRREFLESSSLPLLQEQLKAIRKDYKARVEQLRLGNASQNSTPTQP